MFYRPEDGHGLPHNPFKAIVTPRPIGWISTRGPLGDNLAPYSFFGAVADDPPQVMFSSTGMKDTATAAQQTGVFCCNLVGIDLAVAMNETSAPLPRGMDEFDHAGLDKAECSTIDCPRIALAPASLECRVLDVIALKGGQNHMFIGEVTGVHLRDEFVVEGIFDVTRFSPVSRLGYLDYAAVDEVFQMMRPR